MIWLALWVLRGDQRVNTGSGLFKEVSSLNPAKLYYNLDSRRFGDLAGFMGFAGCSV